MKAIDRSRLKISEEAALWLVRLQQDRSAQLQEQFARWSRQSPLHVEEFLFVSATWRQLDAVNQYDRIALAALDTADKQDGVVTIAPPSGRSNVDCRRGGGWPLLAASALLIVVATFLFWIPQWNGSRSYATATGDQLVIKLADGSVLNLNTRSKVRIRFTEHARDVRLLEGEALFTVAHDAKRPFRVSTDTTVVEAVGTQFNVYRAQTGTRVAVVEGSVRIESREGTVNKAVSLAAGQEANVALGKVQPVAQPSVERAVAWRVRRLIFQSEPLQNVAWEFNRYDSRRPIRLEGPGIRELLISGVFDADDSGPLVEFLEADPELLVRSSSDAVIVRLRDPPASAE